MCVYIYWTNIYEYIVDLFFNSTDKILLLIIIVVKQNQFSSISQIVLQNVKISIFLYPRHLYQGVYSFHLSVCPFVYSSVTFVEFTSKFYIKVSLSGYISPTAHQKAFVFGPSVSSGPRVHGSCPGVGVEVKN